MRFTIRHAGGSGRLGNLTDFSKSPNLNIETPAFSLLTQGGSVVHLTAEVLSKVFLTPQLLSVPLSNSIQLENGAKAQGKGVAKFAGLQEHATCVTLHNTLEIIPKSHFESDKVPLWTKQGKKMITAERYMEIMEVFKPDIIMAIADSNTSINESDKRLAKSVDRTCKMLDKCVNYHKESEQLRNCALIGVIVGVGSEKKCEKCINHLLSHQDYLTGVALSGLSAVTDDDESCKITPAQFEQIFKRIGEVIPEHLVRFVEGSWDPAVIMSAIEHGWDMFDGSYPVKLTHSGRVLALELDVNRHSEEMCILDLTDEKYKDDFRPILAGCACLACRKHTRAYLRHLWSTREMLCSVLMTIHNLHHFDQLFRRARLHIAAGTFPRYKSHVTAQYEAYTRRADELVQHGSSEHNATVKKIRTSDVGTSVARTISNGCGNHH